MSLCDEDGRAAQVGQSVGRWLSLEDFVSSDGSPVKEDDLRCLGFPRNWPAVYSSSEALKALIGKRGRLQGTRVAVAGEPLPEEKVDGLTLCPLQSFGNAERVARAKPGLDVVRGWAVFERLDKAEGSVFVAERYSWNLRTSDGRWVDLTPRPEALSQLLLAESNAGGSSSSQKRQAVLGAQEASLGSKLLGWRFPSLVAAERRLAEQTAQQQKEQKAPSQKAQGASASDQKTSGKDMQHAQSSTAAQSSNRSGAASAGAQAAKPTKVLDYSKWSNIVDSDDEDTDLPAGAALDEDVGVQDLAEVNKKKPLPVPDFLVGNTGGGGGTNCYLSVTKLLDAESDKGESEKSHQLSQVFGKIFHTGLVDAKRQDFYKRSLAALPADAFVVVLGLGSVLPVLRAARRGEKKGALLETSTKLAEVAEHILRANKLAGFPVTVLKGGFDHEDLQATVKRLVPKNAKNVAIVTERLAHDLLSNGIVPSCVAVHKAIRAAVPGAKILHVPRTVELFVTPVEIRSEKLKEFDIRPFNAFRHTTSNDKADFWWWPVRLDNQPNTNCKLLGPAKVLCGFDFERSTEIALEEVRRSLKLEITTRGRCNGVALWWTAKCGAEEYSSRPSMADMASSSAPAAASMPGCRSEWKQAIHYLAGETSLFPGDTLELLSSITPRFTVRMLQQSPFSVEAPPWIQAPNNPKFSATLPVLPYHFLMLQDQERIEVYQRAIRAGVKTLRSKLGRRPRVLDAGCGLGLLGMTAALEGCEVWLCEAVPLMRKMCRDVVAANTQAITEARGLVQLLPPMMSTRIQIGEDVDHKFDMVVAEVMDLWCLGEGIVPTMRHAHKKLLAEGGMMLPSKCMIFVQPMELNMWNQAERENEADLQALGKHLKSKFSPMRIDQFPVRWLTDEPIAALEVDLSKVPDQPKDGEPNMEGGVKLCIRMGGKPALHAKISTATVDHAGTLAGYGIWWASDLGHGNVVSNAPDNPQRSWKQIVRWLDQPRQVAAGEEIQVLTCFNDHQVNVEDIFVSREMAEQYQEQVSAQQGQARPAQAASAAAAAAGQSRQGGRPEVPQQQTKQPPAPFEEEPALEVD